MISGTVILNQVDLYLLGFGNWIFVILFSEKAKKLTGLVTSGIRIGFPKPDFGNFISTTVKQKLHSTLNSTFGQTFVVR